MERGGSTMRPRTAKANVEAPALAEPPRLAASDLRLLVRDPEELLQGDAAPSTTG